MSVLCGNLSTCIVPHPPYISQTMEEMRAQTAHLPQTAHTASNVTLQLPADFSFLRSPRYGDDDGVEGDGLYGRERDDADRAGGVLLAGTGNNRGFAAEYPSSRDVQGG
jgi:hypothetical protein